MQASSQVDAAPAGGAAIAEIAIATGLASVATALLLALGLAHRAGRTTLLDRVAAPASRLLGLPAWAALPTAIATGSLLAALFGMLWDISLHIDDGRDEGPLGNPGHWFILVGLFGTFAAGFLATVLPKGRPSASAARLSGDWYAPVGGLMLLACSAFSLIGFPLDDVWHRLFGQDVTLWGPTHLMLIGGAGLALVGQMVLLVEGRGQRGDAGAPRVTGIAGALHAIRPAAAAGGFLIGMCTFMAEFDFGVAQFRLVFHPILIAFAAGIALTVARLYVGRGGALMAVAFFLVIRGAIAVIVGPGLGETLPTFPLFIAEAILVELVALRLGTARPYAFGAAAGLAIGTVGFLAEYGWSQVGFPIPWSAGVLEQGAILVPLTGVAAGLVGAYVGHVLHAARRPGAERVASVLPAAAGVAAIVAVVGFALPTQSIPGATASVRLTEVQGGPERTVDAEIRISPASAADDPDWVSAIAWQGKTTLHLDHLERVAPGVFRTTKPLPVHGTYKTLVRLHRGREMVGVPVYLPRDTAIPADEVPATAAFTRPFVKDKEILQREAKDGVSGSLWTLGYTVVGLISLSLVIALGWALRRLGATVTAPPTAPRTPRDRQAVAA
jgi:hypothetical protein